MFGNIQAEFAIVLTATKSRVQLLVGADGERTVKTSGESDQVYVNGVFSGGSTNTAKFSLYVSPYLVANQGGRYTKHIYAGSQRIVSKVGDFASYGSDPRRIEYAGANTDGLSVDYKAKYAAQQQVIKDNYKFFDVPYNGTDNDNYADGEGFCCNDGSMEAAVAQARTAQARAVARSFKDPDNYENLQFFYHPDHLGSSSFITNLEGEVVQHIEYVPFGEVFIEERNNVWNTPYLFNAKEFDEETGMYYYGARYYEPRISLWLSVDQLQEKRPNISTYCYTANNPIKFVDPDGNDIVIAGKENTSITLTTNLIDIRVNASSLGINWGGNYVLNGEEVLSAALDIVGIIDPSGVADGLNATLQAKNGDYFGSLISAAGVIPYVGDIAKVGKVGKDVKIINAAIDAVRAEKNAYRSLITGLQKHHLIPKAVYNKRVSELSSLLVRDSGKNLKKLPNKFHGNHPAYSQWISMRLDRMATSKNGITQEGVDKLLHEASRKINDAYDNFKRTGGKENMNDYFKKLLME